MSDFFKEPNQFNFSVSCEQLLMPDGKLRKSLPDTLINEPEVIEAYRTMKLVRAFDKKAIALQRTGQMGTYPSVLGQEAIGVAIGLALSKDDIFAPYYRDVGAQYLRGVSLKELLLYWGGSEKGSDFTGCANDFPNCVPIATQCGHAAGAAVALKTKGAHHAALVTCGEGATSKGDFLETLNLAGAWQLPLVMVVNNNQWAISTPRQIQCGAPTIAQKAVGAGIDGVIVDGNDYFSLRSALDTALNKAYTGKGATLIEAMSYRLGDHTTADDASRYRGANELKEAWLKEPLVRLRKYMVEQKYWSEALENALDIELAKEIDACVSEYLAEPMLPAESMFDHLYEALPAALNDQYAEVRAKSLLSSQESKTTRDSDTHSQIKGEHHGSAI